MLQYKFIPKKSGTFRLTGRMAQQRNQVDGSLTAWDQCNDIYVKMEGNFTAPQVAPSINALKSWNKFYGRGFNAWGTFIQLDVNDVKYQAKYNLEAGEEYTFSISARSKGVCIDYFGLLTVNMTIAEKVALATI